MQTFIFDLDGTLLDSDGDLAAAANAARALVGLSALSVPEVTGGIGHGLTFLLDHVLPGPLSDSEQAAARARFVSYYRAHLMVHTHATLGADEVLEALGGRAGLVTNKPAMFLDPILEALEWRRHFAVIVAGDTLPERKPSAAPLWHAQTQLKADDPVFVGDSEVDQAAAANAGFPFVAVDWGRVEHEPRVKDLRALLEVEWRLS